MIFFRVASLALGQPYDCPSTSEATLKDMGKIDKCQNTTKHILYALFSGHTLYTHNLQPYINNIIISTTLYNGNSTPGPDSILRCRLTGIGNPIVEIRRSHDRLISTMGFPILERRHLFIESGPWCAWFKERK